ncbi:MAG: putative lipid II flippase FtsW, partial [Deltaproteobacteria bacterium]|nr:putative lipid II flippase FtsW [Deltaproteobacteria bacterium]
TKREPMDRLLFIMILFLLAFGLLMIYSASAVLGQKQSGNDAFFFERQLTYAVLGLFVMLILSRIDYAIFNKSMIVWPLLAIVFLGVLACKTPLGMTLNGASRWIKMGPLTIQPAEALKVALVLWLSYSLNKKSLKIKSFSIGFLPHLIIPGILMFATMLQPDFGTTVVMALLTFTLLFIAGAKIGYMILASVVTAPIVYFLVTGSTYRLTRIMTFLDPLATRFTTGYQLSQSLFGYAFGGVWGKGLGDGLQKFLYLPEAHNDFIGSIIGEELGVAGIWFLLLIYAAVVARGIYIALKSDNLFGLYVASGLSMLLAIQTLINLAVSMGLLPTKGLTLPFISYGGSALLVSMAIGGILLSVSRGTQKVIIAGDTTQTSEGEPLKGGNQRIKQTKRQDS